MKLTKIADTKNNLFKMCTFRLHHCTYAVSKRCKNWFSYHQSSPIHCVYTILRFIIPYFLQVTDTGDVIYNNSQSDLNFLEDDVTCKVFYLSFITATVPIKSVVFITNRTLSLCIYYWFDFVISWSNIDQCYVTLHHLCLGHDGVFDRLNMF